MGQIFHAENRTKYGNIRDISDYTSGSDFLSVFTRYLHNSNGEVPYMDAIDWVRTDATRRAQSLLDRSQMPEIKCFDALTRCGALPLFSVFLETALPTTWINYLNNGVD